MPSICRSAERLAMDPGVKARRGSAVGSSDPRSAEQNPLLSLLSGAICSNRDVCFHAHFAPLAALHSDAEGTSSRSPLLRVGRSQVPALLLQLPPNCRGAASEHSLHMELDMEPSKAVPALCHHELLLCNTSLLLLLQDGVLPRLGCCWDLKAVRNRRCSCAGL